MGHRAVGRPFLCCHSMALAPPPWRICSSSFLIFVSKSTMRRVFFSNSGDFRFAVVFRTEADTRRPHALAICDKSSRDTQAEEPRVTVYELWPRLCELRDSECCADLQEMRGSVLPEQLQAELHLARRGGRAANAAAGGRQPGRRRPHTGRRSHITPLLQ